MINIRSNPKTFEASVQVWGKGYRVTEDSEEFQRYIPLKPYPLTPIESSLSSNQLRKHTEPLYAMSSRELLTQRCLLFDQSHLMGICFSKTEDRHRRPSLVLVTASVEISWKGEPLGNKASRIVGLASRLADAYSTIFGGNPSNLEQQLREDKFLPSRTFNLGEEKEDKSIEWESVLDAVSRWRGVTGVATSKLIGLGANVMLGTKHEAERTQQNQGIDGYFDVRDREIHSLSGNLSPWASNIVVPEVKPPSSEVLTKADIKGIENSLELIFNRIDKLYVVTERLLNFVDYKRKR